MQLSIYDIKYTCNVRYASLSDAKQLNYVNLSVYRPTHPPSSVQLNENENVTRQLNVFKHIKKKAANDAQLLM